MKSKLAIWSFILANSTILLFILTSFWTDPVVIVGIFWIIVVLAITSVVLAIMALTKLKGSVEWGDRGYAISSLITVALEILIGYSIYEFLTYPS